ncbi:MAG: EboA domain-containing protein [Pseudomonadota bacterium]|nr:EboA domain-containing protein [Pseudomonadota bacterium]
MTVLDALVSLLRPRLDPATHDWLLDTLDQTTAPLDARVFRSAWSRVGRRLGSQPITPNPEETALLQLVGLWPFAGWGADECGRAALLIQAMNVAAPEAQGPLLDSLYLRGTIRERQALLRALAYLPDPDQHAEVAAQACRTHVVSVFEAIALGNPFPARHLARPHFDQMVQKAITLHLVPAQIIGLPERLSSELTRRRSASGARWGLGAPRTGLEAP